MVKEGFNMGHKISVDYTAINIRVHPHPKTQIYLDLFQTAFKERRSIPLGNSTSATISRLWPLNADKPLDGLIGEIVKYNDIDSNSWVNVETGKSADLDEVSEIYIPKNLRPNGKYFYFIFFPKDHVLVSEIRDKDGSFSPKMQEKFFNYLFSSNDIIEKFKAIDVTIFPDTSLVKNILASKSLKKLDLIIHRPNPNDFSSLEQDILNEMEEQHAKTFEKKLVAQNKQYLEPNEKTKNQIRVAAQNGEVIYTDVNPITGLTEYGSTSDTPFKERGRYDSAQTTPLDFIKVKAAEIVQKLRNKIT